MSYKQAEQEGKIPLRMERNPLVFFNIFWMIIFAAVILSVIGLIFRKSVLLYLSAVLLLPLALYLSATPRFLFWGLVFPLLFAGSAILIQRKRRWLAVMLSVPVYLLVAWLMYAVWNQ
ncbi:hypothetical protein RJP21_14010 [Paenibacillus sp. VCA1]|uniref:hypothetical protein n=1 Tax=Paenibacillus sp. VCA1 TaxID=3039148 RepID=UPI002870DA4C|nr:hypothetical protein [Paenibacillus sp. VCA1]MDR9854725.1 hypothetical protein [Paenibacillus sp. VCA1]